MKLLDNDNDAGGILCICVRRVYFASVGCSLWQQSYLNFFLTSLMLLTDRIKQQWGVDTNVLSFDTIWMWSFYSFEPLLWIMYLFDLSYIFFPTPLPLFFSIAGHCFLFFFYLNNQQTQKKKNNPITGTMQTICTWVTP